MTSWPAASDPTRLAPEDAYRPRAPADLLRGHDSGSLVRDAAALRSRPQQKKKKSRTKREAATWKKLLWVKQSYPDNYTDEATFLDALQRNPRLAPYEFWPLVADTSVIVQQLCTVVVFACCFASIVQERLSPVTVVRWSTAGTVLGWLLWDGWVGQTQAKASNEEAKSPAKVAAIDDSSSIASVGGESDTPSTKLTTDSAPPNHQPPPDTKAWTASTRSQQRIVTAKSAILIYSTLLGLSPILKSLTKSTSSDSIWAISFWLLCLNIIFFDYSSGGGRPSYGSSSRDVSATFPASLSTNAALMASTVLASRLPSTAHVFSLTLFSIQVFGLFPIFRRYLRRVSRAAHLALTWLLVLGAGAGAAVSFSGGGWGAAAVGAVLGSALTGLAMGVCSWWLIGLQRYKNEIHGPWDAARPIVRRFE